MQTLDRPSNNGHASVRTVVVPPPRRPWPWRSLAAGLLAVALIVTGVLVVRARATAVSYTTQSVARQNLVATVTATGTVNPQNTIDVGTQVSGTISEIDADYNTKVHKGQVLAKLDPTTLQAAVDSAKASLAQAEAQAAAAASAAGGSTVGITTAQAQAAAAVADAQAAQATAAASREAIASAQTGVTKAQAALVLAQQTVARDQALLAPGYIPQSQLDTDESNLVAAQTALQSAQVAVTQAQSSAAASVAQAQAGSATSAAQTAAVAAAKIAAAGSNDSAAAQTAAVGIQQANLAQAEYNLAHAVITSPVDGTVIARDVSVGTTVAASLQTPTLFEIAQNLNKMEVDLAVGEPDIGAVHDGEAVDFSVLAYPARTFHGIVSQVRKDPVTTNNVVTYTTVVLVDNSDQALLPGMTANATIHVQTAANALVVPLAALSYHPAGATARTGAAHAATGSASPWGATNAAAGSTATAGSRGHVFVERDGKLVFVPVSIGLVTDTQAAVTPLGTATLAAGDAVVTADSGNGTATHAAHPATAAANPLMGTSATMRVPRS